MPRVEQDLQGYVDELPCRYVKLRFKHRFSEATLAEHAEYALMEVERSLETYPAGRAQPYIEQILDLARRHLVDFGRHYEDVFHEAAAIRSASMLYLFDDEAAKSDPYMLAAEYVLIAVTSATVPNARDACLSAIEQLEQVKRIRRAHYAKGLYD